MSSNERLIAFINVSNEQFIAFVNVSNEQLIAFINVSNEQLIAFINVTNVLHSILCLNSPKHQKLPFFVSHV